MSITGDICRIRLGKSSRITVISVFERALLELHMSIILDTILHIKKTCGDAMLCYAGLGVVAVVAVVAPVGEKWG